MVIFWAGSSTQTNLVKIEAITWSTKHLLQLSIFILLKITFFSIYADGADDSIVSWFYCKLYQISLLPECLFFEIDYLSMSIANPTRAHGELWTSRPYLTSSTWDSQKALGNKEQWIAPKTAIREPPTYHWKVRTFDLSPDNSILFYCVQIVYNMYNSF
jgi:hypothetical protein